MFFIVNKSWQEKCTNTITLAGNNLLLKTPVKYIHKPSFPHPHTLLSNSVTLWIISSLYKLTKPHAIAPAEVRGASCQKRSTVSAAPVTGEGDQRNQSRTDQMKAKLAYGLTNWEAINSRRYRSSGTSSRSDSRDTVFLISGQNIWSHSPALYLGELPAIRLPLGWNYGMRIPPCRIR